MKYINAEKLYEYLGQVGELYPMYEHDIVDDAVSNVIDGIKTFIDSLQQEQPSLSGNLDEAARSYSESDEPLYSPGHRFHWDNDSLFGKQIETAFKAGAEWMAKQIK